MSHTKNKDIWSVLELLTKVLFFILPLLIIFRLSEIISPLTTWGPSVCILLANTNTTKGDSIYLVCLQKKANIYAEKDGYDEEEVKTRKRILNYYQKKNDRISIGYAADLAQYCLITKEINHLNSLNYANRILLKAWKENLLNDKQKLILYKSTLYSYNPTNDDVKKTLHAALDIAETIDSNELKHELRHDVLSALLKRSIDDIQQWSTAQQYFDIFAPHFCASDKVRQRYWITYANYQLGLHNTTLAQQYLDSAMMIDEYYKDDIFEITRIQADIYLANGDIKKSIRERKKQIALLYSGGLNLLPLLYRHILDYENAINKQSIWLVKYYTFITNSELRHFLKRYKRHSNKYSNKQKKTILALINTHSILQARAALMFGSEDKINEIQSWVNDIKKREGLTSEQMLQLIDLGICAAAHSQNDSAHILLEQSFIELQERLKHTFPYMTDGEKSTFWKKEELILRQIYSVTDFAILKYNTALLTKGLLLNSSNRVKRAILESNDTVLIADWQYLQLLRSSYNTSLENKRQGDIRLLADSLEHSIVRRSNEYQQEISTWDITWQDVQNQLKSDECAIEFIHYPINNNGIKDNQYKALLLTKNEAPREFELFKESEFPIGDTILYRSEVKLYQYIWEPLVPYLSNGNIYTSMDGLLHHINIEAMPLENGKLLSEVYNVVRVSSTRELVQSGNVSWVHTTLYGGIKYDLTKQEIQSNAITDTKYKENVSRGYIFRTNKEEKIMQFNMLKYSLQEVQQIDAIIKDYEYTTSLYTNDNASEETFKSLSGKRNSILHIATHGIFDRKSDDYIDPMRRSSLLLAGANNSFRNRGKNNTQEGQDGILTASEISALDLRGTELVVLSACNTAKGDITPDGVFGLQRAFKQAGAQTIIMTLWNINDESTAVFMENLYKALLQGKTKREAFNSTMKLQKERYPDPLHWAGFIMLD